MFKSIANCFVAKKLTYDEQVKLIEQITTENVKFRTALLKIDRVNAMDYEYQGWARDALNKD